MVYWPGKSTRCVWHLTGVTMSCCWLAMADPIRAQQAPQVQPVVEVVQPFELVPAAPVAVLQGVVDEVQVEVQPAAVAAAPAAGAVAGGVPLVKKASAVWKYWDRSEDPGEAWANPDFDDGQWAAGAGPLGYGDQHIKTKVGYGEKRGSKNLVVFFRHTFQLDDPATVPRLAGGVLCDDAAAVYLNGKEVYRRNLPPGPLKLNTRATATVSGAEEQAYWEFLLDQKLLRKGNNTIAVRVHQINRTSADLGFDFELSSVTEQLAQQVQRRMRARAAPRRAAVVQARRATRTFTHLTDGELTYVDQNGVPRKQRMDAVEQARSMLPSSKFVRMMQGDTLAKLAAQYKLDLRKLALLNRADAGKIYTAPDIACVGWLHEVQPGDTLVSLAQLYNTTTQILTDLNHLATGEQLEPGTQISVPGEFSYQYRRQGYSYLRVARYVNMAPARHVPFDQGGIKVRRERLEEGQDLAAFAKKHGVAEPFLRRMNGLDAKAEAEEGRMLLIEYSVDPIEGATLDDFVQFFSVTKNELRAVNDLDADDVTANDVLKPGQRLQIPIGNRFGDDTRRADDQGTEEPVFEVVLGGEAP